MNEEEIVIEIKRLIDQLNEKLKLAAENNIEARIGDMDITEFGDKAKRSLLKIDLFKIL